MRVPFRTALTQPVLSQPASSRLRLSAAGLLPGSPSPSSASVAPAMTVRQSRHRRASHGSIAPARRSFPPTRATHAGQSQAWRSITYRPGTHTLGPSRSSSTGVQPVSPFRRRFPTGGSWPAPQPTRQTRHRRASHGSKPPSRRTSPLTRATHTGQRQAWRSITHRPRHAHARAVALLLNRLPAGFAFQAPCLTGTTSDENAILCESLRLCALASLR